MREKIPDLDGLKVNRSEWYQLKDAVLGVSYHSGESECEWYEKLPQSLKDHEIGRLVRQALYENDKDSLSKAAALLTGGFEKAWLYLAKS